MKVCSISDRMLSMSTVISCTSGVTHSSQRMACTLMKMLASMDGPLHTLFKALFALLRHNIIVS